MTLTKYDIIIMKKNVRGTPKYSVFFLFCLKEGDSVKLTIRQERFCLEYAKTGNATESYKKAGYKGTDYSTIAVNASRLLKTDKVKARLAELADEMASEEIANASEVQKRLTEILRMEETEDTVVIEMEKGVSKARIIQRRPALKDVISAGTTLAKMQGAFDSSVNVNVVVPVIGGDDDLED
jgi:phage terminase small subunit